MKLPSTASLSALMLLSSTTQAGDASLSLLYGDNYVVEPALQSTATIEYAAGWAKGDVFAFIDLKNYHQSDAENSWYGEFSPRVKIIDSRYPLFAAFTWERGKNDTEAYLAGLGTNLTLPGFTFSKVNVYYRDSPNKDGSSWQSTLSWSIPFINGAFIFDGYIDWVFSSQEGAKNIHVNPQLKWDMQKQLNTSMRWYLGFEYDYWDKKYGIDVDSIDSAQNTASFLLKIHF
ncbi:DUF5020 family protein [Simiduia curdlanivorans]|uniref:DUF5020 family protein n=1 Tax=Simiduia curdlanivorans TaxID=1492769 RepID=A0ABV8V5C0_9GAMM|nr:DUF5020 family protein [Simiduia curdlanivorans]MDN3640693.1 DUF5020 family protein [Simiduia curdlanivorans]